MSTIDVRALAEQLWKARTEADVNKLIKVLYAYEPGNKWRPVGDRRNNIGTIRIGSDPALAIIERITNAMDAMLELGHAQHPSEHPANPRQAAQQWFGVPKGGLADMTEKERRELGKEISVSLDESGDPKRPTIVVSDHGVGQSPGAFPTTLLSLNETNKVGLQYTMGTYGQGGAVTFGFSKATLVFSRRDPDLLTGGELDQVGFTLVMEKDDPEKKMLPNYEYLVGPDNEVLAFEPELFPELDFGSRFVHVAYDFQGWIGPFTTGAWQLFHAALFDPVLPFLVTGTRKKEAGYGSRIIIGNAARLNNVESAKGEIELAHSNSWDVDLGTVYGKVTFNYWVVRRPEGSAKSLDPAEGYVKSNSAVSMTLFGQRQDAERRTWIKDQAKLPFLYKNIIIQIDADQLTPIAKRELFSSTRERATESDLRREIYERLADTLLNDDELKTLNHEEKERLLSRSTSAANEKVRKRLQKFITTKLKDQVKEGKGGTESGTEGRQKPKSGGKPSHRNTDDAGLPNVPTHLSFQKKHLRIGQGRRTTVWVEINAKNGYLPAHDDELELTWEGEHPGDKLRVVARSKLLGGLSNWFFEASVEAPLRTFQLRATLMTPNGPLTDTVTLEVFEPPKSDTTSTGIESATGPRVEWVYKDDWDDHTFDINSVGEVTVDDETIIWINRNLGVLDRALSGSKLTPEAIQTRSDRYQFPVACGLWLQQFEAEKAKTKPDEDYVKGELLRLAEAVLAAIDPDVDAALEESEE